MNDSSGVAPGAEAPDHSRNTVTIVRVRSLHRQG
jgi:hypothetical protein